MKLNGLRESGTLMMSDDRQMGKSANFAITVHHNSFFSRRKESKQTRPSTYTYSVTDIYNILRVSHVHMRVYTCARRVCMRVPRIHMHVYTCERISVAILLFIATLHSDLVVKHVCSAMAWSTESQADVVSKGSRK